MQFPVCADVGDATGLREAHTNSIFSLAISVLEYYTARNVMSSFSTVLFKTESKDPISVVFIDGSLYCLILTVYLSYLDQVLLPMAAMPFLY